ncbi:MAG: hypothetical protein HFJ09_08055 [Lachnospiraceae bacterium]|nr:hypothetical protein [Lachnospiraceae bacterium]
MNHTDFIYDKENKCFSIFLKHILISYEEKTNQQMVAFAGSLALEFESKLPHIS